VAGLIFKRGVEGAKRDSSGEPLDLNGSELVKRVSVPNSISSGPNQPSSNYYPRIGIQTHSNSTIPRSRTSIPDERDGERQAADENCLEDILDLNCLEDILDVLLLRIEIPRESAPHRDCNDST